MNQPTECKHCGLHATWHIDDDTFFACGTSWCGRVDVWNQSTGCLEILASRDRIFSTDNRIRRAMDLLEKSTRFYVVNQVIEILERKDNGQAD